jgi:hypothetical protein
MGRSSTDRYVYEEASLAGRIRGMIAVIARGCKQKNQAGMRVAEEGQCLLIDYGPPDGSLSQHLAGHAVETRRRWMSFHALEVARRFYETWSRRLRRRGPVTP